MRVKRRSGLDSAIGSLLINVTPGPSAMTLLLLVAWV